jgi:hypothetical protein
VELSSPSESCWLAKVPSVPLQRMRERRVKRAASPRRLEPSWSCRPLQSLVGWRCSRLCGLPAPGPTFTLAERAIRPVFLPPSLSEEATPRTILSWGSTLLHGPSRSLRPRPLGLGHLSWGFVPLQRSRWRESTARRSPGRASRLCRDSAAWSHPGDYGAARRFSQPLSSLFLPPPSGHVSGRWRSWGSALQGFAPPTQPRRLVVASVPS